MLRFPRAHSAGLSILLASTLLACSNAEPAEPSQRPNVVLVTIDTLRADHLELYGYPRETAPFLAELASAGTAFENAIAACSHTAPAHASIFTSMSPLRHRVVENGQALRAEFASMAGLLREAGYETLAFTSVGFLEGLRSGFDEFHPGGASDDAVTVIDRVVARLDERDRSRPFFCWIHLYDPHQPYWSQDTEYYRELEALSEAEKDAFTDFLFDSHGITLKSIAGRRDAMRALIDRYDAEIRYADNELARLYEHLGRSGDNDDARWIVVADHGEGLKSHGLLGHDMHIYQEQLRIPLIFHRAGGEEDGRMADDLVRQIDVLPTVLDWLGLEPEPRVREAWEGRSLLPILLGGELARPTDFAFSQRRAAPQHPSWVQEEVYAFQNGRYKYIWHERSDDELFDLGADPLELDNRIDDDPELGARLKTSVETLTQSWRDAGLLESVVDGDGHLDELEALGYVGDE